jgi:hypothetical protein
MIQEDDKIKSGEAFFMFGFGSAGYSETEVEYVQVFAKMGSGYRMVKIPLDNVEVIITKNEMPSLQIRYWGHDGDNVDPNTVLYYEQYDYLQIPSFIINCPEELLPEKFSPINL